MNYAKIKPVDGAKLEIAKMVEKLKNKEQQKGCGLLHGSFYCTPLPKKAYTIGAIRCFRHLVSLLGIAVARAVWAAARCRSK